MPPYRSLRSRARKSEPLVPSSWREARARAGDDRRHERQCQHARRSMCRPLECSTNAAVGATPRSSLELPCPGRGSTDRVPPHAGANSGHCAFHDQRASPRRHTRSPARPRRLNSAASHAVCSLSRPRPGVTFDLRADRRGKSQSQPRWAAGTAAFHLGEVIVDTLTCIWCGASAARIVASVA